MNAGSQHAQNGPQIDQFLLLRPQFSQVLPQAFVPLQALLHFGMPSRIKDTLQVAHQDIFGDI